MICGCSFDSVRLVIIDDCIVAENQFGVPRTKGEPAKFGLSNWGRNPHGAGWQPNLNNLIHDNTFGPDDPSGGPSVNHCSPTCSDPKRLDPKRSDPLTAKVCSPAQQHTGEWIGCANNGSFDLGRDCATFNSRMGSYMGAVNINIAWRRNTAREIAIGSAKSNYSWMTERKIPIVSGGVIKHNVYNGKSLS